MAPQTQKSDDASFVTVACKLPHGLQIRVGEQALTLRGSNSPEAIGGYGFTLVNESFWNEWLKSYCNFEPVKKGLIYALAKGGDARARAQEQAEVKNGLEPLNPKSPIPGIKQVPRTDAEPEPGMEEAA